jgi:mannose-1-phosphate guanylyltransferase
MAGGIGSRFWPMSTPEYPKQFVDVMGSGKTMIQMTVERFAPLCPLENMWVVTSEDYVDIVKSQIPEIPHHNILSEPCARNTAPCIAYACWKIMAKHPQANIVVTPSDALVINAEEFRRIIANAIRFASEGERVVTLGIKPTRPETGYGYIAAAEQLAAKGIDAKVINIHTIKPLDDELIVAAAKETGKVVTVEEHSVIGGLGSAVCDCLSAKAPTTVLKIGVNDVFGESGPAAQLIKKYGLDADSIAAKVEAFVK